MRANPPQTMKQAELDALPDHHLDKHLARARVLPGGWRAHIRRVALALLPAAIGGTLFATTGDDALRGVGLLVAILGTIVAYRMMEDAKIRHARANGLYPWHTGSTTGEKLSAIGGGTGTLIRGLYGLAVGIGILFLIIVVIKALWRAA